MLLGVQAFRKVRFTKLNLHRELEAFVDICLILVLFLKLILDVDRSWSISRVKAISLYKNEGSCIDVATGQLAGREAASQKPKTPRKCSHRTADGQKNATKQV